MQRELVWMRRIAIVLGLTVLGVLAATQGVGAAQPEELVVTVFGGTLEKAWRANVIEPFEKQFNAKVRVVSGLSVENLAKLRAQKDNPEIDVFMFDTPIALIGAKEGLLETLDATRIPNLNNVYDFAMDKTRQHVAVYAVSVFLGYNTQFVKQKPTAWADMWKPEYKGKILIPNISQITGAYFIGILGHAFGKGWDDQDAAFAKLKALRPNVLTFTTSHDQTAQLLNQGEGWMQPWSNDRIATQVKAGAPIGMAIPSEGSVFASGAMGIAKGTKHKTLAEQYVNFALSEGPQAADARDIFLAPVNKNVKLTPDVAQFVPYGEVMKHLFTIDWDAFTKQRDLWVDRWNREIK
jgi:putative spermidine/putrescine transport system substrate-binding protein